MLLLSYWINDEKLGIIINTDEISHVAVTEISQDTRGIKGMESTFYYPEKAMLFMKTGQSYEIISDSIRSILNIYGIEEEDFAKGDS